MPIELHLSGNFRKRIGGISDGLSKDKDLVALVYNEMIPTRSFFTLNRDAYIRLLKTAHRVDEAHEIEDMLAKLDTEVNKKYKAMIKKRYEKQI